MESLSLGERLRELRLEAGISLRKLAEAVGKSPPFISDVELGRRFPSDEVLRAIARVLVVDFDDLKKYDHRESISILKQLAQKDASWGLALRTAAEQAKEGTLTAEELVRKLDESGSDRKTEDDE